MLKMAEKQKDFRQEKDYRHIIRVANVDLAGEDHIRIALTNIKGVGINLADALCIVAKIQKNKRAGNLNEEEIRNLNNVIQNPAKFGIPTWMLNRRKDFDSNENMHLLTGTLTFVHDNDLKRLKRIKTLRGIRHQKGLPVRGQRTKSHFRKNKGKVVGVSKKKATPGAAGEKSEKK